MSDSKIRFARYVRILAALLLIALEFTNAFTFFAEGGGRTSLRVHRSRYTIQFAMYGVSFLLCWLDPLAIKRLLARPVMWWAAALLALMTWAMVIRTFNIPLDQTDDYLFLRKFGLWVNNIGFLISCLLIFDDSYVLSLTKRAVIPATLLGVCLNIYDFLSPGIFSNIFGRGAGFYVQPNGAGMALVFGCIIGLTAIRSGWLRQAFFACALVGVVVTFSREALLALAMVTACAILSRTLPLSRLALAAGIGVILFVGFHLNKSRDLQASMSKDTWSRLTFQWSDESTRDRAELASRTLQSFEDAPLLGQGFGTTLYWDVDPSHDTYLSFLADCGVLGALVLPALIFCLWRKEWDFFAFALSFLLWGFFSHTILEDFFSLITIAIEAISRTRKDAALLVPGYLSQEPELSLRPSRSGLAS